MQENGKECTLGEKILTTTHEAHKVFCQLADFFLLSTLYLDYFNKIARCIKF